MPADRVDELMRKEDSNPFAVQLRYETLDAVADFDARQAPGLARNVYEWARAEVGWDDEDESEEPVDLESDGMPF